MRAGSTVRRGSTRVGVSLSQDAMVSKLALPVIFLPETVNDVPEGGRGWMGEGEKRGDKEEEE